VSFWVSDVFDTKFSLWLRRCISCHLQYHITFNPSDGMRSSNFSLTHTGKKHMGCEWVGGLKWKNSTPCYSCSLPVEIQLTHLKCSIFRSLTTSSTGRKEPLLLLMTKASTADWHGGSKWTMVSSLLGTESFWLWYLWCCKFHLILVQFALQQMTLQILERKLILLISTGSGCLCNHTPFCS